MLEVEVSLVDGVVGHLAGARPGRSRPVATSSVLVPVELAHDVVVGLELAVAVDVLDLVHADHRHELRLVEQRAHERRARAPVAHVTPKASILATSGVWSPERSKTQML